MKFYAGIGLFFILIFVSGCGSEEDVDTPPPTHILLINKSNDTLNGFYGYQDDYPNSAWVKNITNIPVGGESTFVFPWTCGIDWRFKVRQPGFIFGDFTDYGYSSVPCEETITCTVYADDQLICDK